MQGILAGWLSTSTVKGIGLLWSSKKRKWRLEAIAAEQVRIEKEGPTDGAGHVNSLILVLK